MVRYALDYHGHEIAEEHHSVTPDAGLEGAKGVLDRLTALTHRLDDDRDPLEPE